ncbi:MAG: TonB-dependent receptor [Bacteroidota bacterium]
MENVAVPTQVISARELQNMGSLRLTDALGELTGLTINYDHGAGIQVQGFDADYTLILIDGEPVIGRTAGTLDLERLTVSGIERIEVVNGPSSSLYGSEALAGVINIITKKADKPLTASFTSRFGTHNTTDFSTSVEASSKRAGVKALINRYSSSGYDLTPDSFGPTTPEFTDYTTDLRAHLDLSDRTKIEFGGRLAIQEQASQFSINQPAEFFGSQEDQTDWSIHPEIKHRLTNRIEVIGTYYRAAFATKTEQRNQDDQSLLFYDSINQRYQKGEIQANGYWSAKHLTVFGAGVVEESLDGDRYGDFKPVAGSQFVYAQHEWLPSSILEANASARFDAHENYASRLTPKLSLLVRPTEKVRVRLSVGSGFKAPAFRQLYLNFTNAAAGYTVLGSTQLSEGLSSLTSTGQIDATFLDLTTIEEITAERSVAYNAGVTVQLSTSLSITLGAFHNNVRDLIETQPIAQKSNGSFVFSYFNLNRIYTRGINLEIESSPLAWLQVATGYQFLEARDREILEAIDAGTVFGRRLSGRDYRIQRSDYDGLLGRSPHSGTIRSTILLPARKMTVSIRAQWRNRYGYRDIDGNTIANLDEEFIPGYMLWHTTATKSWSFKTGQTLTAQLGFRNLFDVVKPTLIPSLPGRTVFSSLQLSL